MFNPTFIIILAWGGPALAATLVVLWTELRRALQDTSKREQVAPASWTRENQIDIEPNPAPPKNGQHVVITVPGIRTFGGWQDRLTAQLEQTETGIIVHNYRFGYFSIIAFAFPFLCLVLRSLVVRRFREEIREQLRENRGARVDLVGHSFGTHVIAYALRSLHREGLDFQVHTVLFAGSVLKVDFPWRSLINSGHVHRVVNDCGTRDDILVLSQATVLLMGMAGRVGFNGSESARFRNRYFDFGHGGYFTDKRGVPDYRFMSEWWLPVLTTDAAPAPHDPREGNTWTGFWTFWCSSNLQEPIRVAVYASIPVALSALVLPLLALAAGNRMP